jgi:hypothetical protein
MEALWVLSGLEIDWFVEGGDFATVWCLKLMHFMMIFFFRS